jgi:plastocyanin
VLLVLFATFGLPGCTPGATAAGAGAGGTAATTIDISLTSSTAVATQYGTAGGYAPAVTMVALGSTVRFVNVDSISHTASSFGGTAFPSASPLGGSALNTNGATLSGGWTSGTLAAGTASQPLLADRAGTYLFGCFFHYDATPPMRGAIIVQ